MTKVLEFGIRTLSHKLARRELSSLEITNALLVRLDELQLTVRPVARALPELARALAAESDARRARNETRGPFDGVPLTLKENLDLAGFPSTLGLPSRTRRSADRDAVVVSILRHAGAVFLAKTNVSQALLFHECRNPVFGTTLHPLDATRTPGGSSGGEAAAIAAHGSPAGIGSDVGGSIRVPCAWTGICGLKPTTDRWSNLGAASARPGQELVRGQLGPMAREVDDLAFLLETVSPALCAEHDPRSAPLPFGAWRDVRVEALKVAVIADDGVVKPSPAVGRAVSEAADALAAAGARVQRVSPLLVDEALAAYFAGMAADGAATLARQLDRRDADEAIAALWRVVLFPALPRRMAALALRVSGERHLALVLEVLGEKRVHELWAVTQRAREIAAAVMETWQHGAWDLVLCPPHATPALPLGGSKDFALAASPSMLWNLVGFPAGVVPVTSVRPDEADKARPPLAGRSKRLHAHADRVDAGSAGLPVGVQLVARPFGDHVALAGMAFLERAFPNARRGG